MKRFAALLATGSFAIASLTPRGDVRNYHANSIQQPFDMGATLLTAEQVRTQFATDLNLNYIVVEVGVYPKNGRGIKVDPADFSIRVIESGQLARSVEPRVISRVLQRKPASPGGVDVYPVIGVGYDTVNGGYGGRAHGIYVTTGVAVTSRAPHAGSTDADRRTMEEELSDHELPAGDTAQPVAGYLYFSRLSKKKDANYEVIYEGRQGRAALPLGRR